MNIWCILWKHSEKKVFTGPIEVAKKILSLRGEWHVYRCKRRNCNFERIEPAGDTKPIGPTFDCHIL